MASTAVGGVEAARFTGADQVHLDGSNPAVARLRQLVGGRDSSDGWRQCWEEGVTPWDLGQPTPAVVELVRSGTLPGGGASVLVPGCGAGYDVVALSGAGRFVVGLDVCDAAIQKAKLLSAAAGDESFFAFVAADFFTWETPEKFDLIFDYTFFCALHPSLRPAWARRMSDLLKPDGELITLIYLVEDQEDGPPFNTTVLDYRSRGSEFQSEVKKILSSVFTPKHGSKDKSDSHTGNGAAVVFCALHPSMRPAWARTSALLKPDGELITLMHLEAGPPFNTSGQDYEEVLNPLGFVIASIQDNEVAVGPRKGREKIARWKRMMAQPTDLHSAE